ncbi:MAG: TetR/AcrR family transcriptional regulator [Novosphingobium sp.]
MDAIRSQPRRNKGYEETHRDLIATAVRLISERGADALSIAELAREMGINRTTVYYHFDSREELIEAVKAHATAELAKGMDMDTSVPERTSHITRFVLENPDIIKLWIDDFVSGGDIRDVYPRWDDLVAGLARRFAEQQPDVEIDAEVYCAILLAGTIIGPRIYANSVKPGTGVETIVELFLREEERTMKRDGLAW